MPLRVHHLDCGTLCPACARLMNGRGGWLEPATLVCHVLLIETPRDGLVLVDTGLGSLDVADPSRLGAAFLALSRPQFDAGRTAVAQVRALGFQPEDVRHIIVTHLDLDHASGLPDFPLAQVHVFEPEFQAAMKPNWRSKARYLPAQWAHSPRWSRHAAGGGERWFGFEGLRPLPGLQDDILLVPLIGHTLGHCGVAVRDDAGWMLHAGDAYFYHGQLAEQPHMPAGLRLFERLVETDRRLRERNRDRLRELALSRAGEVRVFCAHDPVELAGMRG